MNHNRNPCGLLKLYVNIINIIKINNQNITEDEVDWTPNIFLIVMINTKQVIRDQNLKEIFCCVTYKF